VTCSHILSVMVYRGSLKYAQKMAASNAKKQAYRKRRKMVIPYSITKDLNNFDNSGTVGTSNVSFSYINLFAPIQGSSNSQRYGNKTVSYSLQYTLFVEPGANVPMRVLIIYDRQPNTAFPTTPQPLTNLDTTAYKDPDLRRRFKVLRDLWLGNSGANTVTSNDPRHTNLQRGYIKFMLPTQFTSNSGTISSVQSGSFVMVVFNGATVANALVFRTRILFKP